MDLDRAWNLYVEDGDFDKFTVNLDPESRDAFTQGLLLAMRHSESGTPAIFILENLPRANFLGYTFWMLSNQEDSPGI